MYLPCIRRDEQQVRTSSRESALSRPGNSTLSGIGGVLSSHGLQRRPEDKLTIRSRASLLAEMVRKMLLPLMYPPDTLVLYWCATLLCKPYRCYPRASTSRMHQRKTLFLLFHGHYLEYLLWLLASACLFRQLCYLTFFLSPSESHPPSNLTRAWARPASPARSWRRLYLFLFFASWRGYYSFPSDSFAPFNPFSSPKHSRLQKEAYNRCRQVEWVAARCSWCSLSKARRCRMPLQDSDSSPWRWSSTATSQAPSHHPKRRVKANYGQHLYILVYRWLNDRGQCICAYRGWLCWVTVSQTSPNTRKPLWRPQCWAAYNFP